MWIQSEKSLLKLSELVLSHVSVETPCNWKVKELNEEESPFSAFTELQLFVLMVNEFDKFFPVVLFKSVVGEIFGNLPWVIDDVVTKDVHSVRMRPNFGISNLEIAFTDLLVVDIV